MFGKAQTAQLQIRYYNLYKLKKYYTTDAKEL